MASGWRAVTGPDCDTEQGRSAAGTVIGHSNAAALCPGWHGPGSAGTRIWSQYYQITDWLTSHRGQPALGAAATGGPGPAGAGSPSLAVTAFWLHLFWPGRGPTGPFLHNLQVEAGVPFESLGPARPLEAPAPAPQGRSQQVAFQVLVSQLELELAVESLLLHLANTVNTSKT